MDYKRLIKNQETRFKILHLLKFIPDKVMVKLQYKIKLGRFPNIDSPKRFTEKLQWYKLYYRDPLMTVAADKYKVREYVKSKGLGHILNELYAVYSNIDEIDLNYLPDKFVMKTNNGSGTNLICTDKSEISLDTVKREFDQWLSRDIYASGREWSYKGIEPKIIVEEFLESNYNKFHGINDYKFLCFGGKAKYIVFDVDRYTEHKRNIYDLDWNLIDVGTDHPNIREKVEKPEALDEMIKIANKLAEDFPFVRVDLYWVNRKIYFGELTFYPWTGYVQFNPDEFDYKLGEMFSVDKTMM